MSVLHPPLKGCSRLWAADGLQRAVLSGELAPVYPPLDPESAPSAAGGGSTECHECPVCFEDYGGPLNTARCCKQSVCTRCFVETQTPTLSRQYVFSGAFVAYGAFRGCTPRD